MKPQRTYTISDRFYSMAMSLLFSIPTSLILWWLLQLNFWRWVDLGGEHLLLIIALFAALAFMTPRLFPEIMGRIWQFLLKFWGWLS